MIHIKKKSFKKRWVSALGRPRGMVWGGRREEGSGWGTHVYTCGGFISIYGKTNTIL